MLHHAEMVLFLRFSRAVGDRVACFNVAAGETGGEG
jgi:hypothetical protein